MHSVVTLPSMGQQGVGKHHHHQSGYHSFSAVVVATDVSYVCSAVDMEPIEEEEKDAPSSNQEQDPR